MYLSVIVSLNNFTKQTMQGNVQCISCSLSFFFRGYDRSYSISCTLSFLTSRENNVNGTIINKTFDRFDSGKAFGHLSSQKIALIPVKCVQETIFVKIREHGHFLADSENIFGRSFRENPVNLACKVNQKSEMKPSTLSPSSCQCVL